MIAAVLFDAVGTLIHPDPPVATAYAAAGRRFGCSLTEEEIRSRFRAAFARQEAVDAADPSGGASEPRERARWQAIVGEVFGDVADPAGLFDTLWRHFAEPRHWRLSTDAAETWRKLSLPATSGWADGRRLILGIASNFDARLERICAGLAPLAGCRLFISSQLGCRKPSPAFFRAIEARLALKPRQLLLVGDDLVNDYQGAAAAGWNAMLFDPDGRHAGVRAVRKLTELVERGIP